jgi:hypothetical protein
MYAFNGHTKNILCCSQMKNIYHSLPSLTSQSLLITLKRMDFGAEQPKRRDLLVQPENVQDTYVYVANKRE